MNLKKGTKGSVLVTGGAGFIGSHLVDYLIENGFKVVVVDNLSTGKLSNVNDKARFYQMDIAEPSLAKIFKDEDIEYVVHCAAQVSVTKSIKRPDLDMKVNIFGTVNLLELCRKFGIKKFVYLSSAAVYGDPAYLPIDEEHPTKAISFYGESKLTVERYLELYHNLYNFDYTTLRLANVYGPRQNSENGEGGVVAIFINSLLNGKAPTINGDGNQTRDYVFVGDVVDAIATSIQNGLANKTYNIGTGKPTSVNKLYQKIATVVNLNLHPKFRASLKGEMRNVHFDSSKAQKELGWTPKTSLSNGLKATANWFVNNVKRK